MKIGLVDSGIGIVPFIKEIIIQNKKNQYYCYSDCSFFPYGDKSELQLKRRLMYILSLFERYQVSELIICCNTLSYIYNKYKIKSSFKVKTILDLNLKTGGKLLVTPFLSERINGVSGENLAYNIENNNIYEIINFIKNIKEKKLVLSCTHYPIVKKIFEQYDIDVIGNENKLIEELITSEKLEFYADEGTKKLIKKYFHKLCISLISN